MIFSSEIVKCCAFHCAKVISPEKISYGDKSEMQKAIFICLFAHSSIGYLISRSLWLWLALG